MSHRSRRRATLVSQVILSETQVIENSFHESEKGSVRCTIPEDTSCPVGTLWKVERCFSWLKRSYRRIATRWERLSPVYESFMLLGIAFFWVRKLVG